MSVRVMAGFGLTVVLLTPVTPSRADTASGAPPVVYSYGNPVGRTRLVTLDPATGQTKVWVDTADRVTALAWSSATSNLYYGNVQRDGQGSYTTFETDELSDTGGSATKVPTADSTDDLDFSPDGSTYVYYATFQGGQLWKVDAATGSRTRITGAGGKRPRWSPDGLSIVFTRVVAGNSDVYVWSATGIRRITAAAARDESGAFSPDGRRLLFTRYDSKGRGQVCSVGIDGTGLRAVGPGHDPDWASNGWLGYLTEASPAQLAVRSPGLPGTETLMTSHGLPVTAMRFRR